MARKQLFICDLLQRREIGSLHRNEIHQLTEAGTGLADKLLVHNNVIKVMRTDAVIREKKTNGGFRLQLCFVCDVDDKRIEKLRELSVCDFEIEKKIAPTTISDEVTQLTEFNHLNDVYVVMRKVVNNNKHTNCNCIDGILTKCFDISCESWGLKWLQIIDSSVNLF